MKIVAAIGASFVSLLASAAIKEAIGYGTGDDLAQAISVAQGDAVLNAGGKASFVAEVEKDKLVTDSGFLSNEVYLVESKLIEHGESFDGVYARVKAKVSVEEDLSKKNGQIVVEGEGSAKTRDEATIKALGDLILNAGKRIRAYGKFENEELVKDETTLFGDGYLSSFLVTQVTNAAGICRVKVSSTVSPYRCTIDLDSVGKENLGKVNDSDLQQSMARAWKNAFVSSGAGYRSMQVFTSGSLTQNHLVKTLRGKYDKSSIGVSSEASGHAVSVQTTMKSENDLVGSDTVTVPGYGFSADRSEAFLLACGDSVLNHHGLFELSTEYEQGRKVTDTLARSGKAFLCVKNEAALDKGARIDAMVGASLRDVMGSDEECVRGAGAGDTLEASLYAAKYDAIMRSAAELNASSVYKNDKLTTCKVEESAQLQVKGVSVKSKDGSIVDMKFSPCESGMASEKSETVGYGFASDPTAALIQARADAVLNAHGVLSKSLSYELGGEMEGTARVSALGYVGPARTDQTVSGGRAISVVVGSSAGDVRGDRSFKVNGDGVGATASAAVAAARHDAVRNAGMSIEASINYHNGTAKYGSVSGEGGADIRGCSDIRVAREQGRYHATLIATLANASGGGTSARSATGYGTGGDFKQARKNARCDAALSACSTSKQRCLLGEDGKLSEQETLDATCVFFEDEVEFQNQTGVCMAKAKVQFSDAQRSLSGYEEIVRAKGFGTTKESAIQDAERNAVDKVFGRKFKVNAVWQDNSELIYTLTDSAYATGYVQKSKTKEEQQLNGMWAVEIEAIVKDSSKVEGHGFWWYLGVVLLVLLVIGAFALHPALGVIALILAVLAFIFLF